MASETVVERISIARLVGIQRFVHMKLQQKLVNAGKAPDHWKVRIRGIVDTFGGIEVVAMFDGEQFNIQNQVIEWIQEELSGRTMVDTTKNQLERLVRGKKIILQGSRQWSKDFVYASLWEQTEVVKIPRVAHRTLGSWFENNETKALDQEFRDSIAPVITFYSYKGGMGRTTALAFVAQILAARERKVVVIDCDLEAPGLTTLLSGQPISKGLIDYLIESRYDEELSIEDYMISESTYLKIMPAGNVDDEHYLEKLSYVDIEKIEVEEKNPSAFQKLLRRIDEEYKPDYILIDSRTGLTSIGGAMLFRYPKQVFALLAVSEQQKYGLKQLAKNVEGTSGSTQFDWVFTLMPEPGSVRDEQIAVLGNWVSEYINENLMNEDEKNKLCEKLVAFGIERNEALQKSVTLEMIQVEEKRRLYEGLYEHLVRAILQIPTKERGTGGD